MMQRIKRQRTLKSTLSIAKKYAHISGVLSILRATEPSKSEDFLARSQNTRNFPAYSSLEINKKVTFVAVADLEPEAYVVRCRISRGFVDMT